MLLLLLQCLLSSLNICLSGFEPASISMRTSEWAFEGEYRFRARSSSYSDAAAAQIPKYWMENQRWKV
jgi:hypothetical protein